MSAPSVSESTRQHFEQTRLRRAVTALQVLVAVLSVAVAGLVIGLTQVEARLRENASEIHGLRESIQKALGDFEPKVDTVIRKLDEAGAKADGVNKSLGDATGFDQRVDQAIGRASDEIPRSFERFFKAQGARLIAEQVSTPEVQDAGRKQATESLKQALDDPGVEQKAEQKMTAVLNKSFDNLAGGAKKKQQPTPTSQ